LSKVDPPTQEGAVQPIKAGYEVVVTSERLVSHAGVGLLPNWLTGSGSPMGWTATRCP
jgi:hypothetical protein